MASAAAQLGRHQKGPRPGPLRLGGAPGRPECVVGAGGMLTVVGRGARRSGRRGLSREARKAGRCGSPLRPPPSLV